MLTVLALLGVVAVLGVAAAVATRDDALLRPAPPDRADVELPARPLRPDDVTGVRFGMALRGYRMSEVDRVLDRLAAELADRDRMLADAAPPPRLGPGVEPGEPAVDPA